MITKYIRPTSIEAALKLLAKPDTLQLAGGTEINRNQPRPFTAVDLQDLGLDRLQKKNDLLVVGAMVRLQELYNSSFAMEELRQALRREAPLNIRNMRTVAGALISCNGRSSMATILLALNAKIMLLKTGGVTEKTSLSDFLLFHRKNIRSLLVTAIEIPLNVTIAFEVISRTLYDKPILCVCLAAWPSGRRRLTIGGWGEMPTTAFDGTETTGLDIAAENACSDANDSWASAEYRQAIAIELTNRCIAKLE